MKHSISVLALTIIMTLFVAGCSSTSDNSVNKIIVNLNKITGVELQGVANLKAMEEGRPTSPTKELVEDKNKIKNFIKLISDIEVENISQQDMMSALTGIAGPGNYIAVLKKDTDNIASIAIAEDGRIFITLDPKNVNNESIDKRNSPYYRSIEKNSDLKKNTKDALGISF